MVPQSPVPATAPSRLVVAACLLAFVAQAWLVLRLPLPELVALIPDDSFFYLRIAQWFWSTGEFTFDGRNPTYGFQPLWQLLLCLCQPFCQAPGTFLTTTVLLCAALHATTGGVLWRLAVRLAGPWAGLGVAALWLYNPGLWVWSWGVKENALYALCWALALAELQRSGDVGRSRAGSLRLGLWLGLAIWTRVNAVAPAALVLGAWLAWPMGAGLWARGKHIATAAGVALLVAGPWYLYAHLHFGAAMPTSGGWKMQVMRFDVELKRQLPWLGAGHVGQALAAWPPYLRLLLAQGHGHAEAALALLLPLGLLARWRAGAAGRGTLVVLGVAVLAGAAAAFANVLFLDLYLSYALWYAVAEFVAVTLLGSVLLGFVLRWLRSPLARLGLGGALLAALWAWTPPPGLSGRLRQQDLAAPPQLSQLVEMGLWLRRNLPAEMPVGIWDPGIVGYFRGGITTSLDPLMNSLAYQQGFFADPFGFPGRYVEQQGLAYLVGAGLPDQPTQFGALPERPGDPGPAAEVVWVPYPDFDLGWSERRWFQVVRPRHTPAADPLQGVAFPYGVLYPNDPARRRVLTGDRDRLLAGLPWQADVLRVQLALPEAGRAVLRVGGVDTRTFTAADHGWVCLDARGWRGQPVQLVLVAAVPAAVPQAQIVDYTLP